MPLRCNFNNLDNNPDNNLDNNLDENLDENFDNMVLRDAKAFKNHIVLVH